MSKNYYKIVIQILFFIKKINLDSICNFDYSYFNNLEEKKKENESYAGHLPRPIYIGTILTEVHSAV